jgi:hypothetical protein
MGRIERAFIKRMAKNYRLWYPDATIRRAVHEAQIAYEMYREAEIKMMDEEYEQHGQA